MTSPIIGGLSQRAWFRALDHARLTGVKPTYVVGKDYYRVRSPRAGDVYRVDRVQAGRHLTYACDCPAGERGLICWHKALVAALPHEISLRRGFRSEARACTWCGVYKSDADACPRCDGGYLDDPRAITQPLDPLSEAMT